MCASISRMNCACRNILLQERVAADFTLSQEIHCPQSYQPRIPLEALHYSIIGTMVKTLVMVLACSTSDCAMLVPLARAPHSQRCVHSQIPLIPENLKCVLPLDLYALLHLAPILIDPEQRLTGSILVATF